MHVVHYHSTEYLTSKKQDLQVISDDSLVMYWTGPVQEAQLAYSCQGTRQWFLLRVFEIEFVWQKDG